MRKIALVTGGTSGIGLEASKQLAKLGYDLHLIYKNNHEKAQKSKETLKDINNSIKIHTESVDLSNLDDANKAGAAIVEKYRDDEIKIFVSSHGQMKPGLFLQKKSDSIIKTINEHLVSNIILTHQLLPKMCVQSFGRIIYVTSTAAHKINQGQSDYALSKGSLEILVKSLTSEYFHRNITFNCLCLGPTKTTSLDRVLDEIIKKKDALVPTEHLGSVFELLVGDTSSYISGATMVVDSGLLCRNNNSDYHKLSSYAKE